MNNKCETRTIDITNRDCPSIRIGFPKYIRRTPISKPIEYYAIEGMSLDKIAQIHGYETAKEVYWLAAQGIDPTKPEPPMLSIQETIKVMICEKKNEVGDITIEVFLLDRADENRTRLATLHFYPDFDRKFIPNAVDDAIYDWLRPFTYQR